MPEIRTVWLVRVSSSVDKDVDHPQFFDPCYPLKYIQAGLERIGGLTVSLLDCWIHPMEISVLGDHAAGLGADVVVISASSFDVSVGDELARLLRNLPRPPIVVGIGQGFYPLGEQWNGDRVGDRYDAILLGEPEEAFFDLFDRIRTDDAARDGVGWREHYGSLYRERTRFLVQDPDGLPFPSYTADELEACRSIFPVRLPRRVVWGYTIGMRGCPHDCDFCSEVMRVSVGKKLRRRSPGNIADELEHLARQGVNIVSFQDDSFSAHRGFVQGVCQELIARGSNMPWMARARVDEVDRHLLGLMKRAGCIMLGIGVEAGSQRIIDNMRKTRRVEPWSDLCRRVFRWTRELGIGTNAYYVIGNPSETREEIQATIRLARELSSDSIQVHFYTPYPGSKAWERFKDRIDKAECGRMFHYAAPQLAFSRVPIPELVKLRADFYRGYILRPGFAVDHLWKHAGFYLHNPDIFRTLLGIRKLFLRLRPAARDASERAGGLGWKGSRNMSWIGMVPRRCVNLPPGALGLLLGRIASGRVVRGDDQAAFAHRFGQWLDTPHVLGASSGRTAFQLALEALGLERGKEIIFPRLTFPVIPMAARLMGYKPVFCDVDPVTFNAGPEHIEARITDRTGAVLATHLFGQPCPIREIAELTRSRGIRLLEDCAHACGVRVDGRQVGTFGDIGIFSFAEGKNMPCFGGGAIVTADPELARRARSILDDAGVMDSWSMIKLAFSVWVKWVLTRPTIFALTAYPALRLKLALGKPLMDSAVGDELLRHFTDSGPRVGRMTNLQAALGLLQLDHIDAFNEGARRNANTLTESLGVVPGVRPPRVSDEHVYVYYPLTVDSMRRDDLRAFLLRRGVDTKTSDMSDCLRLEAFRSPGGDSGGAPAREASILEICVYPVIPNLEMKRIAGLIRAWAGLPPG
jgi:dTDP-4-amino-4,6-dideoxygalactose transaminase/radical SAM superfamily enzyme YgiQ (UPF0313 family)